MEMSHGKLSSDLLNLEISPWQDPSVVWLRALWQISLEQP